MKSSEREADRSSGAAAVCATCVFEAALRDDVDRLRDLLSAGTLHSLQVPLLPADLHSLCVSMLFGGTPPSYLC